MRLALCCLLWCIGTGWAERAFLSIAIFSSAVNHSRRQNVRETWLRDLKSIHLPIRYVFVVGKSGEYLNELVKMEASMKQDLLVLSSFPEDYQQLARKTQAAFRWAFSGHGSQFLLKCDDDSYVVLNRLIEVLLATQLQGPLYPQLYMGKFLVSKPIRQPGHKHYVSEAQWPGEFYPQFAPGCGYVVGCGLGEYLISLEGWPVFEKIIPPEDVTVGWWMSMLAKQHNITVHYRIEHRIKILREWGCDDSDIIRHQYNEREFREMYANGHACPPSMRDL